MAEVTKEMLNPDSVGLIFPLQTEVTIEISKIGEYAAQLSKLFAFYKKQLQLNGNEIKGYDLGSEIGSLMLFLIQLDLAIKGSNVLKPVIASDPQKTSVFDYEFLTMRIVNQPQGAAIGSADVGLQINSPPSSEVRDYSDGTKRDTLIYNKIDFVYLENKTANRTMTVLSKLDFPLLTVSPSTLALLFNSQQIIRQINQPIPSGLLLCQGKETSLSRLEDGFSFLGFDVGGVTSKVLLSDFLNAYIQPIHKITAAPKPPIPKGCTPEARDRISIVRASMSLHEIQIALAGGLNLIGIEEKKKYEEEKKEFIQLTKLCPDLVSNVSFFESIKDIDKIGKLFTDFLEKFNLACIVDEAIKCVMPQIPCDQILRDLTVDNFESRLQAAFPHQKNIIHAITLNVQDALEKENKKRQDAGQEQLDPAGQTQMVLDTINKVIDLEALCKIDIEAIIELIKNLFNIKLPSFNLFDWQFNFKIDLNLAIIEALLRMLLTMIEQILNELVGCDALDGLIAGIINSNVDAPPGLYGDLAAMLNGDLDFSNTLGTLNNGLQNFLTQSGDQLSKLIVFESKLSNGFLGEAGVSGGLGFGTSADNIIAGNVDTSVNAFGGLVRTSTHTTGNVGVSGFRVSPTSFTGTIDVTKLATNEGQLDFLKEIGKFQLTTDGTDTEVQRISDDSIVELLNSSNNVDIVRSVPATTEQGLQGDVYTPFGARNKNRHILNALVRLNEQQNSAQLIVKQGTLAEQLKAYVKTCFALLSPSETIDLITANASLEVKLTITEIARIRFPLLYGILKYPDRHALIFASFGKLTSLDSVGPRLQILSSNPTVKQKMLDPDICAPFADLKSFRKALIGQVLPQDLANDLMDKLIEDDRQRANNLVNSLADLAKNPKKLADMMTSPAALAPNKTPDGKPIEEIDRALNNTLSNMFDQIKLSFDKDIESYPNASSAPVEEKERVYKFNKVTTTSVYGFQDPGQPEERSVNQEYTVIRNTRGSDPETKEGSDNYYFEKKVHNRKPGALVYDVYRSVKTNYLVDTRKFEIDSSGTLASVDQGLSRFRDTESMANSDIQANSPKWNFKYRENEGKYLFDIRTAGDIVSTNGTSVNYSQRMIVTGSVPELIPEIVHELRVLGFPSEDREISRAKVFSDLIIDTYRKISSNIDLSREEYNNLFGQRGLEIFRSLLSSTIDETPYEEPNSSKLLKQKKVSSFQASDEESKKKRNILLSIVDFSPLQTEQEKACGIDTHLLQLEAVKKRVIDEFNSTTPENVVSTNSKINTRYSDSKPGHLSTKMMTGLAEIFIRTSVIHNIFKGLFVFDKYRYSFSEFALPEMIYMFFEHTVKSDMKTYKLDKDFEKEIEKIYDLYKKDEKKLIPEEDDGSNKLRSIIKYNIDSVLEILKKIVSSYEVTSNITPPSQSTGPALNVDNLRNAVQNSSNISDMSDASNTAQRLRQNLDPGSSNQQPVAQAMIIVTGSFQDPDLRSAFERMVSEQYGIPLNNDPIATKSRTRFFNNLTISHPYSNFYKKLFEDNNSSPPRRTNSSDEANSEPLHPIESPADVKSLYIPDPDLKKDSFTDIFSSNTYPDLESEKYKYIKPKVVLEPYIRLEFNDDASALHYSFKYLKDLFRENYQLNGVVNINNFREIMANLLTATRALRTHQFYFYRPEFLANSIFKAKPKFGLRLSIVQDISAITDLGELAQNQGYYDGIWIPNMSFRFRDAVGGNSPTTLENNTKEKQGLIQLYTIGELPADASEQAIAEKERNKDSVVLQSSRKRIVLPILSKEIDLPKQMYDFDNINLPGAIYDQAYMDSSIPYLFDAARHMMLADPMYDVIVNFCLMENLGKNFSLFNSLLGMASEPMFKLLDGTKELIRKNYDIQKNSGNFKSRDNTGAYQKQKKSAQDGPPSSDFLKAAAIMPINLLKGISTAVDPNIFLADKIVLAGKMGFVQPRYKRVEAGDEVKIEGSRQTKKITSEEAGVAYDGYYNYLDTGELEMKANPTGQGNPHIEFTVVALVDEETKRVKKDRDGKVITRKGPGQAGVPYDLKTKSYVDSNFKDDEDVGGFDTRPSTPIYPGESINIPYSVASLLLAPFPVFGPSSLTTYNVAMPFGPLFLALEPLIYETPQFKASVPKKETSTNKDQNGNVVCEDNKEE